MRCALVLALISACTFHHAVELGGAALATTGLVMIGATSSGDTCSDGLGQCVFTGTVDSVGTSIGTAMVITGVVAAFVALVTDHHDAPSLINRVPRR